MTEDEMKKTTCHRTLAAIPTADGSPPWFSPACCLGSQCSAWRWVVRKTDAGFMDPPHGYCGIAGPP
jgi:hypothetical protein